jgi:metastasis-associated protein MTA
MDTLHKHNYSIEASMCSLVPSSGPVLCRDEMEEWSASEANLFEEALDKYGKDFNDIRNDYVSEKCTYQNDPTCVNVWKHLKFSIYLIQIYNLCFIIFYSFHGKL